MAPVASFFHDLGLAILDRWRRADFDGHAFPDIAASALSVRPPSEHVDPMDVVRWVHEAPALVPQADITLKFGQPPITVFRCEGFYIDVLFWVDGTTAIHQHQFSGAFHVMAGSSLQSTYRFTPKRRYSERLMIGDLELSGVELLTKGDVRPIAAGSALVHALFHLDRPSVSVVVRTPTDDLAGPQYSYSRAGLAFDPFTKTASTERQIQTLDLLHAIDSPELEPLARATVRAADAFSAFQIMTRLPKWIEPHEKYRAFLESVRPAHGPLLDVLAPHVEEERRDVHIISRRRLVKQPEHRFFLALLLNLTNRRHILEMVARAFPDRVPVDTVLAWLADLEKIDAVHTWVAETAKSQPTPILDVRLDTAALATVRRVLEGGANEGTDDTTAALRGSMLLRPLLVG